MGFNQIDTDNDKCISMTELEFFLRDPNLRLYLEALEISLVETKSLFKLLDRDRSGTVDIDEFCEGCLRLKGEAKSFDIHCLMYENQRMLMRWSVFMNFVEEHLEILTDVKGHGGDSACFSDLSARQDAMAAAFSAAVRSKTLGGDNDLLSGTYSYALSPQGDLKAVGVASLS